MGHVFILFTKEVDDGAASYVNHTYYIHKYCVLGFAKTGTYTTCIVYYLLCALVVGFSHSQPLCTHQYVVGYIFNQEEQSKLRESPFEPLLHPSPLPPMFPLAPSPPPPPVSPSFLLL